MANFGYLASPQIISGDFVFEVELDSTNFHPVTFGIIPAAATLSGSASTGGQVQTAFPDRPYFEVSGANVYPMGNVSYSVSWITGDMFSIHRVGNVIRFYKNFQDSAVPVPIYETSYSSSEMVRLYAEFSSLVTTGLQPEWGSVAHKLPRSYKYSANQQVDDFGSTQSSIKVRVYQESAIVGAGYYIEANL